MARRYTAHKRPLSGKTETAWEHRARKASRFSVGVESKARKSSHKPSETATKGRTSTRARSRSVSNNLWLFRPCACFQRFSISGVGGTFAWEADSSALRAVG